MHAYSHVMIHDRSCTQTRLHASSAMHACMITQRWRDRIRFAGVLEPVNVRNIWPCTQKCCLHFRRVGNFLRETTLKYCFDASHYVSFGSKKTLSMRTDAPESSVSVGNVHMTTKTAHIMIKFTFITKIL